MWQKCSLSGSSGGNNEPKIITIGQDTHLNSIETNFNLTLSDKGKYRILTFFYFTSTNGIQCRTDQNLTISGGIISNTLGDFYVQSEIETTTKNAIVNVKRAKTGTSTTMTTITTYIIMQYS